MAQPGARLFGLNATTLHQSSSRQKNPPCIEAPRRQSTPRRSYFFVGTPSSRITCPPMDNRRALTNTPLKVAALLLANFLTCRGEGDSLDFFEKRIRPIFADHCLECHSVESGKSKGGLVLDSREDILRGGDSGPALAGKNPDHSKLIEAVRWTNQDFQMPPKKALSPTQISDLETWVRIGAPHAVESAREKKSKPTAPTVEQGRAFWAFRPISSPAVPVFGQADQQWVQSPIDGFILTSLKQSGLSPSPEADRQT